MSNPIAFHLSRGGKKKVVDKYALISHLLVVLKSLMF